MPNGDFEPMYSTNNIWYDTYTAQCLTNHLEDIGADIDTLQTGKANVNHTHNEYSPINHEHSEYALVNHSHTGYALIGHTHSYNDLEDKPVIPTTLPANGGNSDTVDGKHAADFATVESVDVLQTLVGSTSVQSQISTAVSAITPTSIGAAEEDHVHNYNDLTNKPTSLPANGGNADTVDGKHANDFATAESMSAMETLVGSTSVQSQISNAIDNHTHSYNNLTDKPTSLPANGGNADTVDNKHASDFATVESVDMLQTLVGTTSVQSQITTAMLSQQPNWNQNNSSQIGYINNRPFYSEDASFTEILSSRTLTFSDDYLENPFDLDLVPGDLYIVIWDNTPYTCRAYSNYRYIYLGNASLATSEMEDTGEPFYIGIYCAPEPTAASYSNTNDTVYVKIENSGGTHSIQINKDTTIIHTIDSKYIPNDVLRTTQQALTEMQQAQVRYNIGASDFDGNYNDLYNKPNLIGKSGSGQHSEIFNDYTTNSAIGKYSHVEGYKSKAGNYVSHAEGFTTQANGQYSHAEGYQSIAQEGCSHAEGSVTIASGNASHAEGQGSIASGQTAHAEGYSTNAMGHSSHAEGRGSNDIPSSITTSTNKDTIITTWETTKFNLAKYDQCHTEGDDTLALDSCAHAEGYETIAAGGYSHSEGYKTRAMGTFAHTEGEGTIASSANQHVQGRYNIEDSNSKYLHIVGNGNSNTNRSNAHTVDKNGNGWFAGTIEGTALILKSSTPNSTKRFRITVDDSGTISATAIN